MRILADIVRQDADPVGAPTEMPVEAAPAAKPAPKELVLERELSADDGTFGTIKVEGQTFYTAELPWKNNARDIVHPRRHV